MKLFAEKGVDGVSVKEIGAAAGVTDAAIYKHFTNKDAVAAEAFEEYCGSYTRLVDDYASRSGLFAERLSALVNRVLASYDEDKYGFFALVPASRAVYGGAQEQRTPAAGRFA